MFIPNNQYVINALIHGVPANVDRFFRKKFDNASDDHVSSEPGVAVISREQMIELKTKVDEIVNAYNELVRESVMTDEQRDLSKAMYIYNYILANVMYSQCQFAPNSGNVFGGNPYKNSVYGALVLNDAVCSGMSDAFDCLCKVMGLESTKLLAVPNDPWGGGHAFNSVKIGDKWYKVDVAMEIGLNPGHKIRDGKWRDRNFLIPFSDFNVSACVPAVPNCTDLYPRENIFVMRYRLSSRGLNFVYNSPPQIVHNDIRSALNSFLIKKVGNVDVSVAENFERSVEGSFRIIKRNGIYVAQTQEPVRYIEEENTLSAVNSQGGVELYSNGDSRFVIKSISDGQITGFTILRRNGEVESRLPISKWNPVSASVSDNRRKLR